MFLKVCNYSLSICWVCKLCSHKRRIETAACVKREDVAAGLEVGLGPEPLLPSGRFRATLWRSPWCLPDNLLQAEALVINP